MIDTTNQTLNVYQRLPNDICHKGEPCPGATSLWDISKHPPAT